MRVNSSNRIAGCTSCGIDLHCGKHQVRCAHRHVPYCPAVTPPPPFATSFQEKKGGGGVTMKTCAFASQLSPSPMNLRTEISKTLLCGIRRELLRSTCRGSTESCWPRTCCHFLRNIGGSLTARLLPPAARLHGRIMCRITGLKKPSEISEKGQDQFSNYFPHA